MERLTMVGTGGGISEKTGVTREMLRDRLAAYEETGLEPEEVTELKLAAELERKVGSIAGENLDRIIRSAEAVLAHIEDREELQAYRALGSIEEMSALVKARDDGPCGLCRYNPPSSFDGKPCTMCPAEAAQCEEEQYAD